MRRTKPRIAMLVCLLFMMAGVGAPVASADPSLFATHMFKNDSSEQCLEYFPTNGVRTVNCNGFSPQLWYWSGSIGSTYYIINESDDNKCLDSNDQGHVYARPCEQFNDYQLWTVFRPAGGGLPLIVNYQTGRCLTDLPNSPYVQTHRCDNRYVSQRWHIVL